MLRGFVFFAMLGLAPAGESAKGKSGTCHISIINEKTVVQGADPFSASRHSKHPAFSSLFSKLPECHTNMCVHRFGC